MDTLTYWNGTWHEGNPAILGPREHAFWLGSMVFDGGRAFEGCGPDLDLHAERAVRSAKALGLDRQLLFEMIAESALDERTRSLRLNVSDAEVARQVTEAPAFKGITGQFDRLRFDRF